MKSSPISPDSGATSHTPLVASGGVRSDVEPAVDGFVALDDLMAVIEALCPTWPPRENFGSMPHMRL
jgi:hypothetical protein